MKVAAVGAGLAGVVRGALARSAQRSGSSSGIRTQVVEPNAIHKDSGFRLVVLVGGVALGNGLLMLFAPSQFRGPQYATIAPYLGAYGIVLFLSGCAALAASLTSSRIVPWPSVAAALALVPLWIAFQRAGAVTGVVTLGIQIAAAILASSGAFRRFDLSRPTLITFALIQIAQALAMFLLPHQFDSVVIYGSFGTMLWLFAPSFAVAGVGLLVARSRPLIVLFGSLAAANFLVLTLTLIGTRFWTGVINYGAMTLLVLLTLSTARSRVQAVRVLYGATLALGLMDAGHWIGLTMGLTLAPPDASMIRPINAAALALAAGVGLWSSLSRHPRRRQITAGVIGLAALALVGADLAIFGPGTSVAFEGAGADPRGSAAAAALISLTAAAVAAPLLWAGVRVRMASVIASSAVGGLAAANLFAYVIDQPRLLSASGLITVRSHAAVALVLISAAVLARLVPGLARSSVGARLGLGFGAVVLLVGLEALIAINSAAVLSTAFTADPAAAARQAEAVGAAVVGLLLIIGIAAVGIAIAATKSITGPWRQLAKAMLAFSDGDHTARVQPSGGDEIAAAGSAFNVMARELEEAHRALEALALHDPLTGLPNRRLLADRLGQALRAGSRHSASTSVLSLDLNDFKQINDTFGHAGGDAVLVAVAARLTRALRAPDTVARLGGDEFILVLPDTDREGAEGAAARIRRHLEEVIPVGVASVAVATSIGIATSPADGATAELLLACADRSMYASKPGRA